MWAQFINPDWTQYIPKDFTEKFVARVRAEFDKLCEKTGSTATKAPDHAEGLMWDQYIFAVDAQGMCHGYFRHQQSPYSGERANVQVFEKPDPFESLWKKA